MKFFENALKNGAKIQKINIFAHICIKSGFCNEQKIANISHCALLVVSLVETGAIKVEYNPLSFSPPALIIMDSRRGA